MYNENMYIAIDLKSFYASVECMERGRDPLTTNLLVADESRTEKTICLAVSPSLKALGISGRARLFEAVEAVKKANAERKRRARGVQEGSSDDANELAAHPELAVSYITAPPRMQLYVDYSTRIYDIYLHYVSEEDIHVYSIDEVFMDVSSYLATYRKTAHELAKEILHRVLEETGITATAGIGTNLYLAKIAMDIGAKKIDADADGVRIAEFDEHSYRKALWTHEPLTDFWRIGRGYAAKLAKYGMHTMGDVARCSIQDSELLYGLFGVNAELLIDHAWGVEPCTMADVKAYTPQSNSTTSGQVLKEPYPFEKAKLIVKEMTDLLVLDLVKKHLVTDQIVLTIGYDIENLNNPAIRKQYTGEITADYYGRRVPKPAQGRTNFKPHTSSTRQITDATVALFETIVNPALLIRRVTISAEHLIDENRRETETAFEQMDLFTDYAARAKEAEKQHKEKNLQHAVLSIQERYGKNALLKGMNLEEGAMTVERNSQIGGHKA